MPNKAEGLRAVKEQFPQCFKTDLRLLGGKQYALIIEAHGLLRAFSGFVQRYSSVYLSNEFRNMFKQIDDLEREMSIVDENEEDTPSPHPHLMTERAKGKDVVFYIMKQVKQEFKKRYCDENQNVYGCQTVVVSFDDRRNVPVEKQPTQRERSEAHNKDVVKPYEWDNVSPIIQWDEEVPDWKSVNACRNVRQRVIEDIVEMIKTRYELPPGDTSIIIDYGGDRGHENIPIRLSRTIPGRWEYLPEFKNTVGEGEMMLIYYTKRFLEKGMHVLTSSNDTDCLYLHLVFRECMMMTLGADDPVFKLVVLHRFSATKKVADDMTTRFIQNYCHINHLTTELHRHFNFPSTHMPLLNFSTNMALAGGDYVEGFHNINPTSFFNGYMKHWKAIGPMINVSNPRTLYSALVSAKDNCELMDIISLDIGAVKKAITAAVFESKIYHVNCMKQFDASFTRNSPRCDIGVGDSFVQNTRWDRLTALLQESRKDPRGWLVNITYTVSRTWWYMIYLIGGPFGIVPCGIDGFGWYRDEQGLVHRIEDATHCQMIKDYDATKPPPNRRGKKQNASESTEKTAPSKKKIKTNK